MTMIRYNTDLTDAMPGSFSNLLDKFFNESVNNVKTKRFIPQVDVSETEKGYEIDLAVPGMNKEEFKIDIHEGKLTVSGERKLNNENNGKTWHTLETQYGSFSRSFFLPDLADQSKIEASYKDGILAIRIPKDEKKTLKTTIHVN